MPRRSRRPRRPRPGSPSARRPPAPPSATKRWPAFWRSSSHPASASARWRPMAIACTAPWRTRSCRPAGAPSPRTPRTRTSCCAPCARATWRSTARTSSHISPRTARAMRRSPSSSTAIASRTPPTGAVSWSCAPSPAPLRRPSRSWARTRTPSSWASSSAAIHSRSPTIGTTSRSASITTRWRRPSDLMNGPARAACPWPRTRPPTLRLDAAAPRIAAAVLATSQFANHATMHSGRHRPARPPFAPVGLARGPWPPLGRPAGRGGWRVDCR
mmetsp:Transcript_8812/g.25180  ORF Transcript_8812/g.25180 Transcript_8812/m.25180 type:complete len:272 (-) Transcript_8812:177-992(-)